MNIPAMFVKNEKEGHFFAEQDIIKKLHLRGNWLERRRKRGSLQMIYFTMSEMGPMAEV